MRLLPTDDLTQAVITEMAAKNESDVIQRSIALL